MGTPQHSEHASIFKADTDDIRESPALTLVEQLRAAGVNWPEHEPSAEADAATLPLFGKTVVLTGTLPTLAREEAKAMLEAAGAKAP